MTTSTWPGRRLRMADHIIQRLSSDSQHVESEAGALDDFLPEGAVCLDIGAEYGLYTFTFASRVGASGKVLSFEPLPGPSRWLVRTVRWLGASNVGVDDRALGDRARPGTMSLPIRWRLPVHGRAFLVDDADGLGPNEEFPGEHRLAVTVSTVDDVVAEARLDQVDFIKMDVEGYEPAVLRGAQETLRTFRPVLMIEIEDRHLEKFGADSRTVVDFVRVHGYSMATLWAGRWEPVEVVSDRTRNYLFTPN